MGPSEVEAYQSKCEELVNAAADALPSALLPAALPVADAKLDEFTALLDTGARWSNVKGLVTSRIKDLARLMPAGG